jgi:DNA-binding transcriptional regulator YdaS (Cro superfamily)
MEDQTVRRAVDAAGGATALAAALGIKPPSIYSWRRVPAERVIEVERVTGIPRTVLRPDIYPPDAA